MSWKIVGKGAPSLLGRYGTREIYVENTETKEEKTVVVWDNDNIDDQVGEKIAERDFDED